MANEKTQSKDATGRTKVTAQDSLKRMEEFAKRKDSFIATIRSARIEASLPDLLNARPSL
jgi:hypothetical protein